MVNLVIKNKDWDIFDLAAHILKSNNVKNIQPEYFDREKGIIKFGDSDHAELAKSLFNKFKIETYIDRR